MEGKLWEAPGPMPVALGDVVTIEEVVGLPDPCKYTSNLDDIFPLAVAQADLDAAEWDAQSGMWVIYVDLVNTMGCTYEFGLCMEEEWAAAPRPATSPTFRPTRSTAADAEADGTSH